MTAGHDMAARIHGVPAPQPDPSTEDLAREMQAMSEGVVLDDRVECMGHSYRIADKVGLMPLMRFAYTSKHVDEADLEALISIYEMLKDCIHEADWDRFVREMTVAKAEVEDLLPVVNSTFELITARPSKRPTDSSSGPQPITPTSTDASSQAGPRVPDWARETVPVAQLGVASRA